MYFKRALRVQKVPTIHINIYIFIFHCRCYLYFIAVVAYVSNIVCMLVHGPGVATCDSSRGSVIF